MALHRCTVQQYTVRCSHEGYTCTCTRAEGSRSGRVVLTFTAPPVEALRGDRPFPPFPFAFPRTSPTPACCFLSPFFFCCCRCCCFTPPALFVGFLLLLGASRFVPASFLILLVGTALLLVVVGVLGPAAAAVLVLDRLLALVAPGAAAAGDNEATERLRCCCRCWSWLSRHSIFVRRSACMVHVRSLLPLLSVRCCSCWWVVMCSQYHHYNTPTAIQYFRILYRCLVQRRRVIQCVCYAAHAAHAALVDAKKGYRTGTAVQNNRYKEKYHHASRKIPPTPGHILEGPLHYEQAEGCLGAPKKGGTGSIL